MRHVMQRALHIAVVILIAGGLCACGSSSSATTLSPQELRGQELYLGIGSCRSCHSAEFDVVMVGPSLKGIAAQAAVRQPGQTAAQYLYEAIVDPDAYIAAGFSAGLMPKTYAQLLTSADIEALVAYLMTLQ